MRVGSVAPQAAILDIDGTLLLSNEAHAHAWVQALEEFGYDIPFDRIQPLIGMGGDKLLGSLVPGLSDEEGVGKQLTERRKEIFKEKYVPHLKPAPGSRKLIQRMKENGLSLVIATSAKQDELTSLLKAAQVDDLLGEKVTSDDAEESKPDPDITAVALQKLKTSADRVVMLGDTPYDIESAGKVGVGVIAMRCGGHSDEELAGALAIYDDPADLLAHYDQSPLGRGVTESASQAHSSS